MSSRAPSPLPHTRAQESVRSRSAPAVPEYTPRAPTEALLYSVLYQELEPFLQRANERGLLGMAEPLITSLLGRDAKTRLVLPIRG